MVQFHFLLRKKNYRLQREKLKEILKEEYGKDVQIITDIGSVIGAHAGPGTLALFFRGTER